MTGRNSWPLPSDPTSEPIPPWLVEVLHIVWGFAHREHDRRVLTPSHALRALNDVPPEVLRVARIHNHRRAPGQ